MQTFSMQTFSVVKADGTWVAGPGLSAAEAAVTVLRFGGRSFDFRPEEDGWRLWLCEGGRDWAPTAFCSASRDPDEAEREAYQWVVSPGHWSGGVSAISDAEPIPVWLPDDGPAPENWLQEHLAARRAEMQAFDTLCAPAMGIASKLDAALRYLFPDAYISYGPASTGSVYLSVNMPVLHEVPSFEVRISDHPPSPAGSRVDWYVRSRDGGFGVAWPDVVAHFAVVMSDVPPENLAPGLRAAHPWIEDLPVGGLRYESFACTLAWQARARLAHIAITWRSRDRNRRARVRRLITDIRNLIGWAIASGGDREAAFWSIYSGPPICGYEVAGMRSTRGAQAPNVRRIAHIDPPSTGLDPEERRAL